MREYKTVNINNTIIHNLAQIQQVKINTANCSQFKPRQYLQFSFNIITLSWLKKPQLTNR